MISKDELGKALAQYKQLRDAIAPMFEGNEFADEEIDYVNTELGLDVQAIGVFTNSMAANMAKRFPDQDPTALQVAVVMGIHLGILMARAEKPTDGYSRS